MVGGYTGKILEADLTKNQVRTLPLNEADARSFLGGRGLMNKLLWDRLEPMIQGFDEANQIMFFTGPLTGLLSGNRTIIRFKSPLTATATGLNLMGHTATGGNWAPELKHAGFDGIIIKGKAAEPVYLFVHDDEAEIRSAKHLWGLSIIKTEIKLKEELDPLARVLSIGPAGENLIRYACVNNEYFYSGSRCGAGALMGSKNLKAIVTRGTLDIPVADPDTLLELEKTVYKELTSDPATTYMRKRWGSTTANISSSDSSTGPLWNWRESYWGDEIEKAGAFQFESRLRVKNRGCYGCPMPCNQLGVIRKGEWAGSFDIPDYDSTDLLHPNCGVTDPDGVYALSSFLDHNGLDSISTGNTLSWTMECYEKGILTKDDLGGVELTWGNVPAMFKMVDKIVRREGIGDLLAEGVRIASAKVGKGSEKFAMHCKGVEWGVGGAGNNRDKRETFCYVMSDHGGVHLYGTSVDGQNRTAVADSVTICVRNMTFDANSIHLQTLSRALKAATGWDMLSDQNEFDALSNRIIILERAWNIREGLRPDRDDVLPERVFTEPLTLGPKAGTPAAIYDRRQFEADKQEWYMARGCDERGIPTEATLRKLGLDFVIPTLAKLVDL
jgi:aldehyde:ferredoxin oxidoreductase